MESRSETLRATDVVNKGQGDGFSVRADNLQIWLCDRIPYHYLLETLDCEILRVIFVPAL